MNIKKFIYSTKFPVGILGLILLLAFSIRVYNLNYNSPFIDEAQYIVLGQKVLAGHWQETNPFSWVGGMPLFYPPLSAIFGIFGIIGSRFFNTLLGTLAIFLIYEFAKSLHFSRSENENKLIGLISASFSAILTVPLYLSRLAIYDMLSFALFILGVMFFIKGLSIQKPNLWQRENRFLFSAIFFGAAFLAKYIILVLLPFIILFGLLTTIKRDPKLLKIYLKYFILPISIIVGGYVVWQFNALLHFQTEQISSSGNQSFTIVKNFFNYSLLVLIPASIGTVLLFFTQKRSLSLNLLLLAFITPTIHVITNNLNASIQHTFLSIIFLVPLAAYSFLFIIKKWRFAGSALLVSLLIGTFLYSYPQLRALESRWPNTNAVMDYLKGNTTNHEKVLSSQDDITVLRLANLQEKNITGIYTFEYEDKTGPDAYAKALSEDYFHFVLLDDHDHQEAEKAARKALTSHYKQVYSQESFVVYKLSKK
jgi:hypothetical protein